MEFKVAMLTGLFKYDTSGFRSRTSPRSKSHSLQFLFPKPPREAVEGRPRRRPAVPGTAHSGTGGTCRDPRVKDRRKTYRKKKPA